jgi:hypothetical protein
MFMQEQLTNAEPKGSPFFNDYAYDGHQACGGADGVFVRAHADESAACLALH